MTAPKLMFFELDGGNWNEMNPLLERGELPNLAKLIDRGSSGVLMSESPSFSPKIWTCIFSGKRPEKHGVGFFGANSRIVRTKRIWDILGERGYRVGTFGSLVTWPPYAVDGFMIPSICALGTETYPPEFGFFQELTLSERKKWKQSTGPILGLWQRIALAGTLWRHGVKLGTFLEAAKFLLQSRLQRFGDLDRFWRKAFLHLRLSSEFLLPLLRTYQPDFCTWHIHTCDAVAHRFRTFYEPEVFEERIDPELVARFGHVIPDSYRMADRAIGKALTHLGKSTTIIVASDHGSRALPKAIHPYSPRLDVLLDIFGLTGKVIVARFGPGVYLQFRDKDRDLMLLTEKRLLEACFSETGDPFFFVKRFGNLLLVGKPEEKPKTGKIFEDSPVSLSDLGTFRVNDLLTKQSIRVTSDHDDEGIIIMAGPHVRKGRKLPQSSIYDVTPTILALLGEAVAEDMDGRVIEDAIEPAFLDEHGVGTIGTYENGSREVVDDDEVDHEKLALRLREMGYL